MATERPWPNSAVVHCGPTGQRSHTSGSNSTTLSNAKRCTCPWGHSIVRSRRFSLKADLGNRLPLCDFHGLHTILPRRPSTSSTSPLVDVSPIDQQLVDGDALPLHVDRQGRHGFVLGAIRGRDGARQDQPAIHIRGEMPLEAIEPLALAAM